jgi:hypothetical protein
LEDITGARKIGEVVTEVLEYTPGKFHVEKHVRPKHVLPKEEKIVIGELPTLPIPRGNAGTGLLSHLLTSKFVDHLPFYRQVQLGTCRINNVEPYSWLKNTLTRIPDQSIQELDELLPPLTIHHNNHYRKNKRHQAERLQKFS